MKVLVTGGSGFIGQYCLAQLNAKGYEVHAVSSAPQASKAMVQWHHANLLDIGQARALIRAIKPSHLLHLAWYTQQGKYWTAPENLNWVQGSLALIQEFTESGGERLVTAGTCAEYEWGRGVCIEDQTPLVPATLYGAYKHALQLMQRSWSKQTGLSSAWGRVFSLYGPHENASRLVPSIITALLRDQAAQSKGGNLIRDYLHVADVASAFATLIDSDFEGAVNIASGSGIELKSIVEEIAHQMGRPELLRMETLPISASQPLSLVADSSRLLNLGWSPTYSLAGGLRQTIDWWRTADKRSVIL